MQIYKTPTQRLHLLAVDSIAKSRRSAELAVSKFVNLIVDDPELVVALVGPENLHQIALKYLRETLSRDMDGGGIGLVPKKAAFPDKTGSNAVAEVVGQSTCDAQSSRASPSAPSSETPSITTAGGGHSDSDAHSTTASPSSSRPWSPSDIAPADKDSRAGVTSHLHIQPGKGSTLKGPYVAPKERVSAKDQGRMKNAVATTVLDTLKVRGLPIGDWTHEQAMEQAEGMEWDSKVLRAFAVGVPPGRMIREFITPREAENILKGLEASRAA